MAEGCSRPVLNEPFIAVGAITRHRCVSGEPATLNQQVTAQGATVKGVVLENYVNGEGGVIVTSGNVAVEAAGVIAAGADVMASANGRVLTWALAPGQQVCGRAREAATGAGHIFEIELRTEAAGMP